MSDLRQRLAGLSDAKRAILARQLGALASTREPIAVLGMGCRLPGGVRSPAEFWEFLLEGRDAVGRAAPARGLPPTARAAGYLDQVDQFDPGCFGISPREAVQMDPQQRLLLQVAWEALEDAGIPVVSLAGSATGVYVGVHSFSADYYLLQLAQPGRLDAHGSTGAAHSIVANRLSYVLDLRGPSMAIDTACSSSLVAVHQACLALHAGEVDLAVAGGVNLMLLPPASEAFDELGILSADDRCRTFDARANGIARGEGVGAVVLKRLRDAERDGDEVLAVIRGSAVNQDGASNGLTAPNGAAQRDVVKRARAGAGLGAEPTVLIETHGTGTPLGDPIEVAALAEAMPGLAGPCWLGAVKTGIGHLEAAAGVAGLIKAVLCLQHRRVPPNLHFAELNPQIDLGATFAVPTTTVPLPADGRLVAGVSSFGFGGTNAHVTLTTADPVARPAPAAPAAVQVLPISARSEGALQDLAARFAARIGDLAPHDVGAVAASAAHRRSHHAWRLAAAGSTGADLAADLRRKAAMPRDRGTSRPVAFVFSGQGTQWPGMATDLLRAEPVFANTVAEVARHYRAVTGHDLLALLETGDEQRLADTIVAQPAIFALQMGLSALLASWGIRPDLVIGHSVGEIAAAAVSGGLSLADAVLVVAHRARLMQQIPRGGRMAQVELTDAELRAAIQASGLPLSVAAVNGPTACVAAGPAAAVATLMDTLGARGVRCRAVPVEYAFHSADVEPILAPLADAIRAIQPGSPTVPMMSSVTVRPVAAATLDAAYWCRNVRETVQFGPAVAAALDLGMGCFVEVGPHPALGAGVMAVAEERGASVAVVGTLRRGRPPVLAIREAAAQAFEAGIDLDWGVLAPPCPPVKLPGYPWQERRYWLEPGDPTALADHVLGSTGRAARLTHAVEWEVLAAGANPGAVSPGGWLVVEWGVQPSGALADALASVGASVSTARIPAAKADWTAVFDAARRQFGSDWTGVAFDARTADDPTSAIDLTALAGELAAALAVNHPDVRLWILTAGAVALGREPRLAPAQATLWGLGRSLALEVPGTWGGIVDLDPARPALGVDDAARLMALPPGDEDQVALRDGARWVPRLVPGTTPGTEALSFRADASYVITGAFGGLGPRVLQWAATAGARHLVLVGRRGLPADAAEAAAAIEAATALGATCEVAAADVGSDDAMTALFAAATERGRPVAGVIHVAGAAEFRPVDQIDRASVERAFQAKVAGTMALHRQTLRHPVEFFILFSSMTASLGAKHLGLYAAANQFLDTLAAARRLAGLPGTSIQWGAWSDIRLLDGVSAADMRQLGQRTLPDQAALDAMGWAAVSGQTQIVIADIDSAGMSQAYQSARPRPFLARLASGGTSESTSTPEAATLPAAIAGLDAAAARLRILDAVRDAAAGILGFDSADAIDPDRGLFDLGMDSLMAVRLRRRLEQISGLALATTLVFNYPRPVDLARRVGDMLGVTDAPDPTSDEDIRALLLAELKAVTGGAA